VCVPDNPSEAQDALRGALRLAALYDGHVVLLEAGASAEHVADPAAAAGPGEAGPRDARAAVSVPSISRLSALAPSEAARISVHRMTGITVDAIADEAARTGADVVVIARDRRRRPGGVSPLTQGVACRVPCAVLVYSSAAPTREVRAHDIFARVLCAVDGAEGSMHAVAVAAGVAGAGGGELLVVHLAQPSGCPPAAWQEPAVDASSVCQRVKQVVPAFTRTECTVAAMHSTEPARAILDAAASELADLIVVPRHGWPASDDASRVVSEVIARADCAVLVAP